MNFPKYHQTNSQERLGVNAVAEAIAKIGQIWRETPMADVGIDGQIEYVSPEGFATGRMIAVQIKSGPSFFKESKGDWVFYPEEKHRFYWERFPLPVLIIIHNPETNLSYWQDARQVLRVAKSTDAKGIIIPKSNVLQSTGAQTLFKGFAVIDQDFMLVEEVLDYLIKAKSNNASFPVSYFNLFCSGLTNICRSLYFGMDVAITVAEVELHNQNSPFGVGMGDSEHNFLFEYIKFIVHQHIADVDFSDCMIDWYDRAMQPSFMAPLTSRGKELVRLIHELECRLKAEDRIEDTGLLRVAQEGFVQLLFTTSEIQRIELTNKVQREYLKIA
ncbi:DUF4365 domain-containing protein [Klebsiella pneumoniae]|uniref:DUF4365 domain-containing protein n=1 Tax=Klebsiella pneumoniae TaxID=573 RepID=UPI000E039213|nr:DUF4365 domain-containing protein [Klebsiella pneumoniae]ELA2811097.1 DUF4365 domain-containing protein [Klebsiella aerogenes]MCS5845600.1 DUF4365 domain-containing protein [Klebsiella pneumoniae subsp. pneumoniae]HAV1770567.1 DUF4365 domain-containing protein [Enterobacter hormaechei subsp. xiangfangensis]MBY8441081.1 DUF4365 domain-containing protein [Klebsiella pneumoniae]QIV01750.1 DUF4365 domain-containing protein [Klebsiella pneumoniae]